MSKNNKLPNIFLIVLDSVRADHLSCYGYFRKTSPHIDKIAQESTLFERCFSVSSWTPPSHASLFTGLFPSEHGINGDNLYLDEGLSYLPKLLRNRGYRTIAFSNTPHISRDRGFHNGFTDFIEISRVPYPSVFDSIRIKMKDVLAGRDSGARKINSLVLDWLECNLGQKSPIFMFINYVEAHAPYKLPFPCRNRFLKNHKGVNLRKVKKVSKDIYLYLAKRVDMDNDDFKALAAIYDEEILYLDSMLGKLVDCLRKKKILSETFLIITADHGENLGGHQLVGHNLGLYNSLLHVPLLVRWPQIFPQGKRIKTLVQSIDIYPTLLQIIGMEDKVQSNPYSLSLLEVLKEERKSRYIFAQYKSNTALLKGLKKKYPEFNTAKYDQDFLMTSDGQYKYIMSSTGQRELYDISSDFQERRNIIGTDSTLERKMDKILKNWMKSMHYFKAKKRQRDDELTKKRLEDLGYI